MLFLSATANRMQLRLRLRSSMEQVRRLQFSTTVSQGGFMKLNPELVASFPELNQLFTNAKITPSVLQNQIAVTERAFDILYAATGFHSSASRSLFVKKIQLYLQSNNIHKATETFQSVQKYFKQPQARGQTQAQQPQDELYTYISLTLASYHLNHGELDTALTIVDKTLENVEKYSDTNEWFSATYGLKGLIHFYRSDAHVNNSAKNEDIELAETYLQLAARWSQNILQETLALNNLGSFFYLTANTTFHSQMWQQDFETLPISAYNNRSVKNDKNVTTTLSNVSFSADSEKRIRVAMEYWNEAVQLIENNKQKSNNNNNAAAAAAAAMCGVTPAATTTANVLSPDDSVKYTSFSSTSTTTVPPSSNDNASESSSSSSLLSDVELSLAYATVLMNLAETSTIFGDLSTSSSLLTTALNTLQNHQPKESTASLPANGALSVESRLRWSGNMGKVLMLMGHQMMFSSQAVSSEGLFRASFDYYSLSTNAASSLSSSSSSVLLNADPRFAYDAAILQGRLGLLLSKWDKREEQGKALIATALATLNPKSTVNTTTTSTTTEPSLTTKLSFTPSKFIVSNTFLNHVNYM